HTAFLQSLYELLLKITTDWREVMVPKVPHVSAENPDDTHQQLLDIIGMHPNSIEFYKRYLQTLDMLYSYAYFVFPFDQVKSGFDKMEFGKAYQLLIDLGYDPNANQTNGELPLLSKLYGLDDQWEHKVIIDTVPLSERDQIRSYTADNRNYIKALIDAAATSLDAVRTEKGLTEKPSALLFAFLKFALEQGYFDTAVRLHEAADLFSPQQSRTIRAEQPFLHMQWDDKMVESRYALLYKNEVKISPNKSVGDRITELIVNPAALRLISPGLEQQMKAMQFLENCSTARLERAFVEHLDTCSYRLDAWHQGLIKLQLMLMRQNQPEIEDDPLPTQNGIYLGAFGWLENVKPDTAKILTPKIPEKELQSEFPLAYMTDEANAGYIHAPSVNQAVTSAVLRNAYIANGKADDNSALAVNLSSERIRLALSVIEGIQNGQSLAALLGYKFERMLRDQPNLVNKGIDTFIYGLRKRFPLNANRILDTQVENDPSVDPDTIPITAVEARNVIHGKNMIDHIRKQIPSKKSYPFGFPPDKLEPADVVVTAAINEAVNFIMNIEDAIADLGMAESVHQVCLGNYDRAAGVLESYSNGSYPQEPEVIRTPRSGPTLMHRVGLPMTFIPVVAFDTLHPRRSAEPSLNEWLSSMIPSMAKIVCYYQYLDRTDDVIKKEPLTMSQLDLLPIDLLYLLNTTGQSALSELDELVIQYVHQHKTPRLDTDIELEYITRPGDPTMFSVFEVMALIKSLRELILKSAPLKPTDMHLATEASTKTELVLTLDRSRVDNVIIDLDGILNGDFKTQVIDVLDPLSCDLDNPADPQREPILQHVDQYVATLITQVLRLKRFGLPQTGIGNIYKTRQEIIISLRNKVQEVIDRFEKRKSEYNTLLAAFDPLAEDA
ncbi:MAG TPA: hypothetical protein VFF90_06860, partial [Saprospiraceae bacterium]|nr:hypothetical protein [Saprospiraceae bacterium]